MPKKVAFLVSEMAPFAKTGGLADVAGALPPALARLDIDVRVFVPYYRSESVRDLPVEPALKHNDPVAVSLGGHELSFHLLAASDGPDPRHRTYFVDCPKLFARPTIYTNDSDEPLRFLFFSRAVFESCQRLGFAPDLLHCNDWQTALAPLFLKTLYAWDRLFEKTKSLLTIHNLGYQGVFSSEWYDYLEVREPRAIDGDDLEAGRINFLKTGLTHADRISTVSPTYAREIQTAALGMGCDALLRRRGRQLTGIVNGVDYEVWSPRIDPWIDYRYSEKSLWRKKKNKEAFATQAGLSTEQNVPLVGMVSRLTSQKGLELVWEVLPDFLGHDEIRLAVLGTGESHYERWFEELRTRFPDRVFFYRGHHEQLAHRIEAAADLFLMPSRYEPCGLNQMFSLKYGTVPIVHRTGGLADTVSLYDPETDEGNGFAFDHFNADGLRWALGTAISIFRQPDVWKRIQLNGMKEDFSWHTRAEEYAGLYDEITRSS